jgi:hypothetical protein
MLPTVRRHIPAIREHVDREHVWALVFCLDRLTPQGQCMLIYNFATLAEGDPREEQVAEVLNVFGTFQGLLPAYKTTTPFWGHKPVHTYWERRTEDGSIQKVGHLYPRE